ncbi:hypothetical protein ACFB49_21770 [Sphingomonas sp. DBB INV C78]
MQIDDAPHACRGGPQGIDPDFGHRTLFKKRHFAAATIYGLKRLSGVEDRVAQRPACEEAIEDHLPVGRTKRLPPFCETGISGEKVSEARTEALHRIRVETLDG